MVTNAKIGLGISFAIGDGASPEVFTAVAEVTGISGPGFDRDSVDATHTGSPGNRREFIPGLSDEGSFTINLNFTSVAYSALDLEKPKTVVTNYQVLFPSGAQTVQWDFAGFMTGLEADAPLEDVMSAVATFKITSVPTLVLT